MSYTERAALDTLLYKENSRLSTSGNDGPDDKHTAAVVTGEKSVQHPLQKEQKHNWWCPLSYGKYKFPLKPPRALRDLPDDTPHEKRIKFAKRLGFWAALSSGGSSE
ncbi:uncharacterized protein L201_000725 [Kwoniella dendrophila CBS 6074]|uniref:Uncharacterized protein n=1 Tax=Kwoniella dendrophila CBS 6074 TaxID=1295534 RepID=A0AAX4JN71_9TREE